jgi:uncharacterized membrane protein YkvA (DUF1232 family)
MNTGLFDQLKKRAAGLKRQTIALYLAGRDPRTPWYAKALAAAVVAYALSPVDLIPDFIPVLGYLDDLVIIPAGVALFIRLVTPAVWADCQARSGERPVDKRLGWAAALVIVLVWVVVLMTLAGLTIKHIKHAP